MMYTGEICEQAGVDNSNAASTAMMGAQVIFTALSCVLVERLGRRALLLGSTACMTLTTCTLTYYYLAKDIDGLWAPPEMALAALGIYILGFSLGLGPVPWLILVELFPTEVVNKAASVAVGVAWISTFLVDLLFLPLEEAITKEGIFLSFTIFCATCFFFVLTLVPETKGRTVAQVLALMQDCNDITP